MSNDNRRDVATRKVPFFQNLASRLVKLGLTPNQISVMSSLFAAVAGASLYATVAADFSQKIIWVVIAILAIQLRLICNLIDGLMAVEGGLKTPSGELFNDVPDRVSDAFILLGAGWAATAWHEHMLHLGWLAAVIAILTAYVRTLGAAMTGKHDFSGPMAKQHRMFLVCLGSIGLLFQPVVMVIALVVVALGSFVTCLNRLARIHRQLNGK